MKKLFLVLALAISIIKGEEDMPEECKSGNHKDLVGKFHEHRHLGYRTSDQFLTMNIHERAENYSVGFDKWFRFRTIHAKRLLEATELPTVIEDKQASTFYPCGTSDIHGHYFTMWLYFIRTTDILVLNDIHPKRKYELLLTTTIGCFYVAYASAWRVDCVTKHRGGIQYRECTRYLNCRTDTIPIAVRNCGDFYIYKSQIIPDKGKKTGVFCGTKKETSKDVDQCDDYQTIEADDRFWDKEAPLTRSSSCNDDNKFKRNMVWYRFQSAAYGHPMRLAEYCPSKISNQAYPYLTNTTYCGAQYRGWIQGSHPTIEEGQVTRTICFSRADRCTCEFSSEMSIINCGTFHIYRRSISGFPHCGARACTVLDERGGIRTTTTTTTTSVEASVSESYYSMAQMLSSDVRVTDSVMASSSIIPTKSQPIVMPSSSMAMMLKHQYEAVNLCRNYETIVGNSRILKTIDELRSSNSKCELRYREAVRFISSNGENLQLAEDCSSTDQFDRRCSTFASNVWLPKGGNPKIPGVQVVEMCINSVFSISRYFFAKDYCNCRRREFIFVQRCPGNTAETDFFVYRLHPLLNNPRSRYLDSKDCRIRYCMEFQPGALPANKTIFAPKQQESIVIGGSFTITTPIVNSAHLTEDYFVDNTSTTYIFLVEVVKEKVELSMKLHTDKVTRIEIIGFRIGSLIVDYKIYGTDKLNNETIRNTITSSFKKQPGISISKNGNSFSGTIDPQSLQLKAVDACKSMPCHVNATCTNKGGNGIFTCECKKQFSGDGFTCDRTVHVKVVVKKVSNEWSNNAVIIVSILFVLCFITIVVLALCVFCSKRRSSNDNQNAFKRNHYGNYYSTDVQLKEKAASEDEIGVIKNLYTTEQKPDGNVNKSTSKDSHDAQEA